MARPIGPRLWMALSGVAMVGGLAGVVALMVPAHHRCPSHAVEGDRPAPGTAAEAIWAAHGLTRLEDCLELKAARKWNQAYDCARQVELVGPEAPARELERLSQRESGNAYLDDHMRQALRNGDLRQARRMLQRISADSVYKPEAEARLAEAEAPPPPPPEDCSDDMVADETMQAENQYNSGYPTSALVLMQKALACKPDIRAYRLAAMFACGAHDEAAARVYYANVPARFQAAIQQKCQATHVDLGLK